MLSLNIFDFDNTLFNSPRDSDKNKSLFEKETGVPWHVNKGLSVSLSKKLGRPINPRTGWWGRNETLMPPLVPDPVPQSMWIEDTLKDFVKYRQEPDSVTCIMTGRHTGMKQCLLRILHQGGFVAVNKINSNNKDFYEWADPDVFLYMLGMNGPIPTYAEGKPGETFPWKVWIVNQFRELYPELERVRFWEDRDEHVEKFRKLNDEFKEEVTVYHVK